VRARALAALLCDISAGERSWLEDAGARSRFATRQRWPFLTWSSLAPVWHTAWRALALLLQHMEDAVREDALMLTALRCSSQRKPSQHPAIALAFAAWQCNCASMRHQCPLPFSEPAGLPLQAPLAFWLLPGEGESLLQQHAAAQWSPLELAWVGRALRLHPLPLPTERASGG
jgi:hypothetical protein